MNRLFLFLLGLTFSAVSYGQSIIEISPVNIEASSEYKVGPIENLLDGNLKTYWNPKNKKRRYGVEEYFIVGFDQPYHFNSIRVFPGYGGRGKSGYSTNNRVSFISIEYDGKESLQYELDDHYGFQVIEIERIAQSLKIKMDGRIIGNGTDASKKTLLFSEIEFKVINPAIVKEFENDKALLQSESLAYDEVLEYEERLSKDYKYLFPVERDDYKKLVELQKTRVLSEVTTEINDFILSLPASYSSIKKVDSTIESVNKDYHRSLKETEVKSTLVLAQKKKEALLQINLTRLERIINSATSFYALELLQGNYLRYVESSAVADEIREAISAHRKVIADSIARRNAELARQKALAEEQARLAEQQLLLQYGFNTFNIEGLENEQLINNFFKGNFIDIPYNRDSYLFALFIKEYMYASARVCGNSYTDRIEIKEDHCKTKRCDEDYFGNLSNCYCIEWVSRGTGLFTSTDLYEAYLRIKVILEKDQLKNAGKFIFGSGQNKSTLGGLDEVYALEKASRYLKADFKSLVSKHSCDNKSLDRFKQNVIAFALNEPPIKISGEREEILVDYTLTHDYGQLMEDLVYENSKDWAFSYISNSVANVNVQSNTLGIPVKISAKYKYRGIFGVQYDLVEITFDNGRPECIYFPNFSSNCRTPDRKIVAKLAKGDYATD